MKCIDDSKGLKAEGENTSTGRPVSNQSVSDVLKNLEGEQEIYGDENVKKIASLCLRYLRDKREVPRRDMKMSVYLKFLDDPSETTIREILKENEDLTEKDMWEMGKSALDLIEEKTDMVEITKDENGHIYRWKR
ncbi:MAG: hypothetical protein ACOCSJ_01450 [Candidatus Natronoplasma sp.]